MAELVGDEVFNLRLMSISPALSGSFSSQGSRLPKPSLVRPGAHVGPDGVHYTVWAPDHATMSVAIERGGDEIILPLERDDHGYWRGLDRAGRAGDLYKFVLPDGGRYPDIASRFQPQGVHGPSECVDPSAYAWRSTEWERPEWVGQVIYEMHVGTFTREGTFRAAIERLDHVRALGAQAVELMPVADFPGERNWGYDGVALYAPARCYGRPDDFRAFVDAAHERGLAVILDVVYNHIGPVGNYLPTYCASYFHASRSSPWGQAYDLDGNRSVPVRSFILSNIVYWLEEFRVDGFRLDATHAIPDESRPHLLQEITEAVHNRGGFVLAEDERNFAGLMHEADGSGFGLDGAWSDDFHHEVRVALTGTRESYFAAFTGTAEDLAATLRHGWAYRGRPFAPWKGKPRGGPCDHLPPSGFIFCIENHDQVGNRAKGERLEHLVSGERFRAASALLCLSPYCPMLLMGQEWAASSPFLYFTDHEGEHGRKVSEVRKREFEESGLNRGVTDVPDPQDPHIFTASKLNWNELGQPEHAGALALYQACLRERNTWLRGPALERQRWEVHEWEGWIGIRYRLTEGDRLLLFALRDEQAIGPVSEWPESLQPPSASSWHVVLYSNERSFGGDASDVTEPADIAGPAAAWLVAIAEDDHAQS